MWFAFWLLPLVTLVDSNDQTPNELSSSDYEPIFEIDFSGSENEAGQTVTKPLKVFKNLDDTKNALTKILYANSFEEQRQKEAEMLAELHRKREALEAQLGATDEERMRGGRFGGRNLGGRFGRLGFGTSGTSGNAPSSEEPKPKTSKSRNERPTTTTTTTTSKTTTTKAMTRKSTTRAVKTSVSTQNNKQQTINNNNVNNHTGKQRCFVCNGLSASECAEKKQIVTCARGEACQTEFRWQNGDVKIESTCKQKNACMVMISQNDNCKRLKGHVGANRTCWRCCVGDLCNKTMLNPANV